jgi:phosphoglycolate phosphatase
MPGIPRGVNVQAVPGSRRVPQLDLTGATIVFDLDGTLVDTAPDLANALNDVLARGGHDTVSLETIRHAVGHGARIMIEEALRRAGVTDDIDRMLAEFLVHYEANIAAESRPFPGAVAALESLAGAGARLAVCTNKRAHLSRKLLAALDLQSHFQAIAGRDTYAVSKPDPGHLIQVIAAAGGDRRSAVMVGDSVTDLLAAQGADIPSILVSFGYAAHSLEGINPDATIDHFDELVPTAARLLEATRLGVRDGRRAGQTPQ